MRTGPINTPGIWSDMPHRIPQRDPEKSVCMSMCGCVGVCVCVYSRKSIEQIWNRCIGSDTSSYLNPTNRPKQSWQSLLWMGSQTSSLTSAGAEVFEGVRDHLCTIVELRLRRGGGLRLVRVDSSVGVHRLLVGPHQRHFLLVALLLFHLHHHCSPLWAYGWYIPVHSQDDKLDKHPQQAHEDLGVRRKMTKMSSNISLQEKDLNIKILENYQERRSVQRIKDIKRRAVSNYVEK